MRNAFTLAAVVAVLGVTSTSFGHHINAGISGWIRDGCPNWFTEPPPKWLDGLVAPAVRTSSSTVTVTIDGHHDFKMPLSACLGCPSVAVGQSFSFRFASFQGGGAWPYGGQNVCGTLHDE